jgi:hypothetical protein
VLVRDYSNLKCQINPPQAQVVEAFQLASIAAGEHLVQALATINLFSILYKCG